MSLQEGPDRIANALYNGIKQLTVRGTTYAGDATDTVHIIANGTAGGISVMAQFLMKDQASRQQMDTAYKFSALLINRMTSRFDENGPDVAYHIGAVRAALDDFKKLYGHDADDALIPNLVAAAEDKEAVAHANLIAKAVAAGSVINLRDYTKH